MGIYYFIFWTVLGEYDIIVKSSGTKSIIINVNVNAQFILRVVIDGKYYLWPNLTRFIIPTADARIKNN